MPTQTQDPAVDSLQAPAVEAPRAHAHIESITHVEPQPLLEPIRQVKRHSIHWKRKVFHVLGVGAAGFTYAFAPVGWAAAAVILGSIALIFVTLDLARFYVPSLNKKVKRDFGSLMRDYELDGISGSSWFFIAGVASILLFPKVAVCLGFIYLAIGDPVASSVGVKFGRIKIPGGKSLEGSLAFFAICSLVGTIVLVTAFGYAWASAAILASVAAVAGAFAEWLPLNRKLDDNFTVPLITSALVSGILAAGLLV